MKTKLLIAVFCLMNCMATITAQSNLTGTYNGELTISLGEPGVPEAKSIDIFDNGNGTINFVLPNFNFMGALDLGNIVLLNVPVANGELTLENYPLYIPTLTMAVNVSISEGSAFANEALAVNLIIDIPDMTMQVPVDFTGTRAVAASEGTYQVRNSGFEGEWDAVEYNASKKGVEPKHWNSFLTVTGSLASMASDANQLKESSLTRPGSEGGKSALITSRYVLIAKANGNLTTGRINAGSMTPANAANYNASDPANGDDFFCPFTGAPDSLSAWVKYRPANGNIADTKNVASVSAVLHNESRYQDPEGNTTDYSQVKTAEARTSYTAIDNYAWQRISVPFVYSETFTPDNTKNILVSFSTNVTPGGGTTTSSMKDSIWVDDLNMVYNSRLSSLTVGEEVVSLENGVFDYQLAQIYDDENAVITALGNGKASTAISAFNRNAKTAAVIVKGNDFTANTANVHTYTLRFKPSTTGWEKVNAIPTTLCVNGRTLHVISAVLTSDIEVYTIDGNLISISDEREIQLPTAGMYLIRVNGETHKIVVG